MLKKLCKRGTSASLTLDKPLLKLLDLEDNSTVQIQIFGNKMEITKAPAELTFKQTYLSVANERSKLLKAIADA
jgi:hypothetical protein